MAEVEGENACYLQQGIKKFKQSMRFASGSQSGH